MPVRKRTQLVDQRPSRRTISEDDTHKTLFERQSHIQKEKEREQQQQQHERQAVEKGKGKQREEFAPGSESADLPQASAAAPLKLEEKRESAPPVPKPEEQTSRVPAPPAEVSAPAPSVAPPIPAVQPGVPMMADPKDSDDEDDSFTPPTAIRSDAPPSLPPIAAGQEDENPMADILDSYVGPEDQPIAAAPGASGVAGSAALKRATSGDTTGSGSRLRGPRGARGPRPAGGRSLGMTQGEEEGETGSDSPVGGGKSENLGTMARQAARGGCAELMCSEAWSYIKEQRQRHGSAV